MTKKPLSKALKTFFGVSDIGFAMINTYSGTFWAFWMTDIALFSLDSYSKIASLSSLLYVCVGWASGIWIERSNMKWGKVRSWLLIGPPIMLLLFVLQFIRLPGSEASAALFLIIIGGLRSAFQQIPYSANLGLIPIIASNSEERGLLAARKSFWNNTSRILFPLTITVAVTSLIASGKTPMVVYPAMAAVPVFVTWAGYWAHFFMTKGYEETKEERTARIAASGAVEESKKKSDKLTVTQMLTITFKNLPLLATILCDCARMFGMSLVQTLAIYYFNYVAERPDMLSGGLLAMNIGALLGAFLCTITIPKLGIKTNALAALALLAISLICCRIFILNMWVWIVCCLCANVAIYAVMSTVWAMYAEVSTYVEWKWEIKASSYINGLGNIPIGLSMYLTAPIIANALKSAGYVAGETSMEVKMAIGSIYTKLGAPFAAVVFVLMFFIYKLDKNKMGKMQAEIDARKVS